MALPEVIEANRRNTMPTIMFDEYRVYYSAPKRAKRLKFNIQVDLKYNNAQVGTLKFYPDDYSPLPDDKVYAMSRGSIVYLNYYERQFAHILDLIRNESPMYIYSSASPGVSGSCTPTEGDIRTTDEAVGEEEGV